MPRLSVTVITLNEADHLAAALESVAWADELVVVDSGSVDSTVAIARRFTDRVVVRPWSGYVDQKNFAASIATHDWILSLDADERVTPALAAEIREALRDKPAHAAYRMPRVAWHLGRWIRSMDWYPDYQLRLYDRRSAQWTGKYVHEAISVCGAIGTLRADLQHFPYRDIAEHAETIARYTTYAARQMHESGRRARWVDLAFQPPLAFGRNYLLKGGFREGTVGLIVSGMNAFYVLLKFAKLWELQRTSHPAPRTSPSPSAPRTPH